MSKADFWGCIPVGREPALNALDAILSSNGFSGIRAHHGMNSAPLSASCVTYRSDETGVHGGPGIDFKSCKRRIQALALSLQNRSEMCTDASEGIMASYSEKGGYCKSCDDRVVVRRKAINHILHLLLSCVTAGFWIIIWVGIGIKFGGWHCNRCGSAASTHVPRSIKRRVAVAG